jgi:hypothetical protein
MDDRDCSWSGNADVVHILDEATIPVVVLFAICYYALLRAGNFNLLLAQRKSEKSMDQLTEGHPCFNPGVLHRFTLLIKWL